jgi:predicted  nucleic acid-binding Zn-ribbon protein
VSDSMQTYPPPPGDSSSSMKTAVLAGAVVAMLAANVYLYMQVDVLKTDISKLRESIATEVTNLRENSTASSATHRKSIETLKSELEAARRTAATAASHAKSEAESHADQIAKQLAAEQKRQAQEVASEISAVKAEANTTNTKIGEVNTEVSSVKSQVASTKSELDKTIGDLKKVTGDLGVQSGYIATNGKELSALKRLNDRNYFEFSLAKGKTPQKVGDITLLLRKTDLKKHKYTVEVYADDVMTEKKDKNINEPIQLYVSKAGRQPYELVVNQVGKDLIKGYLATPKDQIARN